MSANGTPKPTLVTATTVYFNAAPDTGIFAYRLSDESTCVSITTGTGSNFTFYLSPDQTIEWAMKLTAAAQEQWTAMRDRFHKASEGVEPVVIPVGTITN